MVLFIFMFQLQDTASLFPLCLIHVDSFTENVKLTSAPFSDFAPQGGGGVETDSDTPRMSPWPLYASVHVMEIHELPLSLKVSRIFQFLYVNNIQRKAARESGGRGHSHALCGREQGLLRRGTEPPLQRARLRHRSGCGPHCASKMLSTTGTLSNY